MLIFSLDEINAIIEKIKTVDYSNATAELRESKTNLENSIKQYSLVNNPSEAYVIECLKRVPGIMGISAATEDNDPNGHLGKAGGYTAAIYFSHEFIDQSTIYGDSIIDKGTDCGGQIEVYATEEDANRRNDYLATLDGGIFASGSHRVIGTVLIRTSDELKASQQKEVEANVLTELIRIDQ